MATFSSSRPKLSDFYTFSHKGYTFHSGMHPHNLHLGELCSPPNDPNPKMILLTLIHCMIPTFPLVKLELILKKFKERQLKMGL